LFIDTLRLLTVETDVPLHLLSTFQTYFPGKRPTHTVQAVGYEAWAAGLPTDDARFTLACAELGGRAAFTWQSARRGEGVNHRPLPQWAQLPARVMVKLCAEGLDVPGLSVALMGERPNTPRFEYGLAVAVAALLHALHDRPYTPDSLVKLIDAAKR
jgi:hypothetical protein